MSVRVAKAAVTTSLAVFGLSACAAGTGETPPVDPIAATTQRESPVVSHDPVTASFQRMLTHEPNSVAPPPPKNFERDPLIETVALPLLRWSAANGQRQAHECRRVLPGVRNERCRPPQ